MSARDYASPLATVRASAHMGWRHGPRRSMGTGEKELWSLAVMMRTHGSQEETKMASQSAGVVRRGQARVKTW